MKKSAKFLSIFVPLLVLITLLIVILWCLLLPENVKDSLGLLQWSRYTRNIHLRATPPPWVEEEIEANSKSSTEHLRLNVMLRELAELGVSRPEDVMSFVTNDLACKELKPHVRSFERYCKHVPDKKLYVRLFKAIRSFYSIFCRGDERYRKLFTQWQEELLSLHEQFVDCEGPPDWYENGNATMLCSEAANIRNCYVETLRMEIGSGAAKAWENIFLNVLNQAMIQPCTFVEVKHPHSSFDNLFGSTASAAKQVISLMFLTLVNIFILWFSEFFIEILSEQRIKNVWSWPTRAVSLKCRET